MKETEKIAVPVSEKYMLTIKEASEYFSIGVKTMSRLAEENEGSFALYLGNHYLIVRTKFEDYIETLINKEEETDHEENGN